MEVKNLIEQLNQFKGKTIIAFADDLSFMVETDNYTFCNDGTITLFDEYEHEFKDDLNNYQVTWFFKEDRLPLNLHYLYLTFNNVWETRKENKEIQIVEMSVNHLANTVKMILTVLTNTEEKTELTEYYSMILPRLLQELESRAFSVNETYKELEFEEDVEDLEEDEELDECSDNCCDCDECKCHSDDEKEEEKKNIKEITLEFHIKNIEASTL